MQFPIRINKYLAEKGVSTRRGADALIAQGVITINGKVAVLGDIIRKNDIVKVGDEGMQKEYVYYAYNKPLNIVTSLPNPGEKSIMDVLQIPPLANGDIPKVFPIGRLDKDSTGIIILTNDGRVTDRLLNPKADHEKEYRVEVSRVINNTLLKFIKEGVRLGTAVMKPAKIRKTSDYTFDIILTEGKNRQIRRMCKSLGFEVTKLTRFRVMNIELKKMKEGELKQLTGKELKTFLELLKLS